MTRRQISLRFARCQAHDRIQRQLLAHEVFALMFGASK